MDTPSAYASIVNEIEELLPADAIVVDAHTHLGADEDGQSLQPAALLEFLDQVSPTARACTFPFHDPERAPAYRLPNDRVLAWAKESGGRLYPYCRLDPADDPVAEAERCLALGARGIKLHPRAQSFGFGNEAAESIWKVADEADVPILIHTGRGMPPMDPLADLASRYPEVVLILAHAAIADQGMFASRLRDHPGIYYDTSTFSVFDQLELFARIPLERIVFASDVPYGRPIGAVHTALRISAYAGLDEAERTALLGGTMIAILERRAPAAPKAPRVPEIRPVSGRLTRINGYLMMSFAAALSAGPPPDFSRGSAVRLARAGGLPGPRPRERRRRARADRPPALGRRAAPRQRWRGRSRGGRPGDGGGRDRRHRTARRGRVSTVAALGTEADPLRVAIVGSGPSAFYAAADLLNGKARPELVATVDMLDRLPTPWGLVRGGVAPDHPNIKAVSRVFEKTAARPGFRFFGNVELGRDIDHDELRDRYHAVVYAVGAETDRRMDIPGEDLAGSHCGHRVRRLVQRPSRLPRARVRPERPARGRDRRRQRRARRRPDARAQHR